MNGCRRKKVSGGSGVVGARSLLHNPGGGSGLSMRWDGEGVGTGGNSDREGDGDWRGGGRPSSRGHFRISVGLLLGVVQVHRAGHRVACGK